MCGCEPQREPNASEEPGLPLSLRTNLNLLKHSLAIIPPRLTCQNSSLTYCHKKILCGCSHAEMKTCKCWHAFIIGTVSARTQTRTRKSKLIAHVLVHTLTVTLQQQETGTTGNTALCFLLTSAQVLRFNALHSAHPLWLETAPVNLFNGEGGFIYNLQR